MDQGEVRVQNDGISALIISGGGTDAYVDGPLELNGNVVSGVQEFPVGEMDTWAPLEIEFAGFITSDFRVEYNGAAFSDLTTDGTLNNVSEVEHWVLERRTGSDDVKVKLHWKNDLNSGVDNLADLRVARYDGTDWTSNGQDANSGTINPTGWVQSSTVTNYSRTEFTFGSVSSSVNPLPVVLVDIQIAQVEENIRLSWTTTQEENIESYNIERSIDGNIFEPIGQVPAKQNFNGYNQYSFLDKPEAEGLYYYRLKSVEANSLHEELGTKRISYYSGESGFSIFPNPAKETLNVVSSSEIYQIRIMDEMGAEIKIFEDMEQGQILDLETLESGVYLIQCLGDGFVQTKRFVKE